MNIINIFISLLLFVIGAFIKYKKVTWLISGYNTSSKEEKEKYDIDKLTHYVGNFIFLLALVWSILTVLCMIFPLLVETIIIVGCGVLFIVMIIGVIYLNTNNRVKK